jgi:hypothetical protein
MGINWRKYGKVQINGSADINALALECVNILSYVLSESYAYSLLAQPIAPVELHDCFILYQMTKNCEGTVVVLWDEWNSVVSCKFVTSAAYKFILTIIFHVPVVCYKMWYSSVLVRVFCRTFFCNKSLLSYLESYKHIPSNIA